MKRFLLCGLAAIAMVVFGQSSQAGMTFTFNKSNQTNSPPTSGTFGTITLTDTSDGEGVGTVRFHFQVTDPNNRFFEIGINTNMNILSTAQVTGPNSGWTTTVDVIPPIDGGQGMDGFGRFNIVVGSNGNAAGDRLASGDIVITGTSGNLEDFVFFSTSSGPNPPDNGASLFGGHLFFADLPSNANTFYVAVQGGGTPTQFSAVPAPPALLLAVTGMGCMGLVRRFRKSKTVA